MALAIRVLRLATFQPTSHMLLTCALPFLVKAGTVHVFSKNLQVRLLHAYESSARGIQPLNANVPEMLDFSVAKMLAKSPDDRYAHTL